ncbi:MAG: hypothetical protein J2P28_06045 [Actinobacteria bacterium]|nr:hypothetical protein [Actinomycetota bacterium]
MTYQPYPTAGGSNLAQQPPPQRPQSVRIAVILMYVGAVLSAASLIVALAGSGSIRTAIANQNAKAATPLTAAQLHSVENATITVLVIFGLVGIGLWLWMAWANGRGKGWARVVASVFFGLSTLSLLALFVRATGGQAIFSVVQWLVGLGALIYLWRGETTQFIAQSQAPYGR